ncbi:MAG TPA: polyamine ABC transporter substrate-binding protein [Methylocella sp.]|nr:polyamine ABC transporter substrate-binding protein [Methylocella sp.]
MSGILFPAFGQGKIVNVYGWSDYIDPKVIEDFTKETGIKVTYDTYNSDGALEGRLRAGKTGFDVVIVSGRVLQRQIAAGIYLRLDKSKLPNSKTLWPEVMARLAVHDPGNQYAVNYMWFTAGIAYNVERAKEIAGDALAGASLAGAPAQLSAPLVDSWNILFKPDNLKKFASCGVDVLDSAEDLFPIALQYLRLDPASIRQTDLKRAAGLLSSMRRDVKKFESSEYADALANGDICLAVGYSGDSFQARDRAREAENGIEIDYVIPREGAPILFDNLAIPKDAPHVEEAYAFINFLLRPGIAARSTNFTHLANGVLASKSLVDNTIAGNTSIYPSAALMQRLFASGNHDPATQMAIAREWARIKLGKDAR